MRQTISQHLPRGDYALLWKPKHLDGVSVLKAHFSRFSYKKHAHSEFAIGVIERGVQTFQHSGSRYVAHSGTMITLNPDEVHDGMSASENGYQYRMVYIAPLKIHDMLASHFSHKYHLEFFKSPIVLDNQVASSLRHALHLFDEERNSWLESETFLTQALTGLFRSYAGRTFNLINHTKDRRIVQHALEFIRARVTENITLNQIATAVGLSRYHFIRIFKNTTGLPPHAYQIQMRLALAKEAIEKGNSLADAAFEFGFSDQSHMTRCFKSVYGLPPGQYKRLLFLK